MEHQLLADQGKAIRDPVWGYIHLPPSVQAKTCRHRRLPTSSQHNPTWICSSRLPRSTPFAFRTLVGVYHLAKQFMSRLLVSDPPLQLADEDIRVFVAATLLHDIGHYPFRIRLRSLCRFSCCTKSALDRSFSTKIAPYTTYCRINLKSIHSCSQRH